MSDSLNEELLRRAWHEGNLWRRHINMLFLDDDLKTHQTALYFLAGYNLHPVFIHPEPPPMLGHTTTQELVTPLDATYKHLQSSQTWLATLLEHFGYLKLCKLAELFVPGLNYMFEQLGEDEEGLFLGQSPIIELVTWYLADRPSKLEDYYMSLQQLLPLQSVIFYLDGDIKIMGCTIPTKG